MPTKIEWADETWNPITGCTPVSEGCRNCYAQRMARRLAGRYGYPEAPHHFDVTVHPDKFDQPLHWKRPRRIFVCSMGDLFHEDVGGEYIVMVFAAMALCPQHTFLVLTKRPERLRWLETKRFEIETVQLSNGLRRCITCQRNMDWPLPNVLLGVTVESQDYTWRLEELLRIPAAGHFVSLEPMLGRVDLFDYLGGCLDCDDYMLGHREHGDMYHGNHWGPKLDWVILGGESGPGARPCHPDWARSVKDQCIEAGVPFLFKQWGAWAPLMASSDYPYKVRFGTFIGDEWVPGVRPLGGDMHNACGMFRVGKKAAGRLLDGRTWDEYPEALQ